MIGVNFIGIPIIKRFIIILGKGKNVEFDIMDYQYLMKKLMYLLQITQSNLVFVISKLRQYIANLCLDH